MPAEESILIRITGDAGSALRATRDEQAALAGLKAQVGQVSRQASEAGAQTARAYGEQAAAAKTSAAAQVAAGEKAVAANRETGSSARMAGTGIGSMVKQALAVSGAFALYGDAKNATETTTDLAKSTVFLHHVTGLSIKSASEWAGIAKVRGIETRSFNMSVATLAKNLTAAAEGGSKQMAMFRALGFTQADVKRGTDDFDFALTKVAQGFGNMQGSANKAHDAQALLGRGWQTLLPLFNQGAKSLNEQIALADKYGVTFSGKSVKSIRELIMAEHEAEYAQLGLQIAFAQTLAPALTDIIHHVSGLADALRRGDYSAFEKRLGDAITNAANTAGRLAPHVVAAFVRGFLNAGPWGQLVAGAWIVSKFGGWGSIFGKRGAADGAAYGNAFFAKASVILAGLAVYKDLLGPVTGPGLSAPKSENQIADLQKRGYNVSYSNDGQYIVGTTPHGKPYKQKVHNRAKGGPAEGLTVVGEEGPELALFPRGTHVFSNRDSRAIAGLMNLRSVDAGALRAGAPATAPLSRPAAAALIGAGVTGFAKGGTVGVASAAGVVPAVDYLIHLMRDRFGLAVTSTTGGQHAAGSYHYQGKAADFAGAQMEKAASWVTSSGLYRTLLEGIHNPNLSVKGGHKVSSAFWGAETWAEHRNHVHLAADHIATTVKNALGHPGQQAAGPKPISGHLTLGQLVTIAKQVGFPDPALAAAIAFAESRGDTHAHATKGEDSRGPWQINVAPEGNPQYAKRNLYDPFVNARTALQISHGGRDFSPWTTYRDGAYKQFLGGRATPLPHGGGAVTGGSTFADYLALRLLEAQGTPGKRDDIYWIGRGLDYWQGVYRRNRSVGNWSRASEALQSVRDLKGQLKDARAKRRPPREVFRLGNLTKIGKWNVAGLQGTLDQIALDQAKAALTDPLDDDMSAAQHLVTIWKDLYTLAAGGIVNGITYPAAGTRAQVTEAAQNLKSALDARQSLQDQAAQAAPTSDTETRTADLLRAQLQSTQAELRLTQNQTPVFDSFVKQLQGAGLPFLGGFQKGGVVLVGERGPELAAVPHGTRIVSNDETRQMLQGGSSTGDTPHFSIHLHGDLRLAEQISAQIKQEAPGAVDRTLGRRTRTISLAPGRR